MVSENGAFSGADQAKYHGTSWPGCLRIMARLSGEAKARCAPDKLHSQVETSPPRVPWVATVQRLAEPRGLRVTKGGQ